MNSFAARLLILFASISGAAAAAGEAPLPRTTDETRQAAPATAGVQPSAPAPDPNTTADEDWDRVAPAKHAERWRPHRRSSDDDSDDLVSFFSDSQLTQDREAHSVVSIVGSSTSAGSADTVVSIIGDTKVSGPVQESAVAVLGNTTVDGPIEGDAVAVLGDVNLGPHAEVGGRVVSVLGRVNRDPGAIVHGGVRNIAAGGIGSASWLHAWIHRCLFYGRPLALDTDVTWAWIVSLSLLALYAVLALLFPKELSRCAQTLNAEPGRCALAALITLLLIPILVALLCITLIGIAAVPFIFLALLFASLFGKAVMLAWIGQRLLSGRSASPAQPVIAVLVGGALVLMLYVVPMLGFIIYKLLGIIGLGTLAYRGVSTLRERQAEKVARDTPGRAASSAHAPSAQPPSGVPFYAALPRAGFWIRMAALAVDVVLVGFAVSLLHPFHGRFHLVLLAAYGAIMWKLRGATVGGIVFDLQVVRLDGRTIEWETAIVRALGCILSLAVAGLGFIWIALDASQQAWHDKLAGTVVVRVRKVPAAATVA